MLEEAARKSSSDGLASNALIAERIADFCAEFLAFCLTLSSARLIADLIFANVFTSKLI